MMRITLCGSMAALEDMLMVQKWLEDDGHEVKIPTPEVVTPEGKSQAILLHFEKIDWSDLIVVVNSPKNGIDDYIGGNTLMEMGFAFGLGKGIVCLNGIPDIPAKDEITAMRPAIAAGDRMNLLDILNGNKLCDHTSVGVVIYNKGGDLLLIERNTFPWGYASPTGHIDEDSGDLHFLYAACREIEEEVGIKLDPTTLKSIYRDRRFNLCRRLGGNYHDWEFFEAHIDTATVTIAPREVKSYFWADKVALARLAADTEAYRRGEISEGQWRARPGLVPDAYDMYYEFGIL